MARSANLDIFAAEADMAAFVRFEAADFHQREIVFQVIVNEVFNGDIQVALIALHGQNVTEEQEVLQLPIQYWPLIIS
jgi:hypothetical protein